MSEERRLILWLLVFAALAAFVYILRGALFPFIAGMAVAYLLDPVADWLERRGLPRLVASLLIVSVFILALAAVLVVLVPILIDQLMDLIARAPGYIDNVRREVTPILRKIRANLTPGQAAQIDEAIRSHVGDLIGWIGTIVSGIVSGRRTSPCPPHSLAMAAASAAVGSRRTPPCGVRTGRPVRRTVNAPSSRPIATLS